MSISTLAARHGLNGQTLRKQYKERISGYRGWNQMDHAEDYILYPENLGEDMSLDETSLSNGEVYTILTNKAAHGGKGALAVMVRGVATDTVAGVLRMLPPNIRRRVRTVTTDLSSAMMPAARKAFPMATLINDRFHVQQLMSEAVDHLRMRHRWEVLEAENKVIKEHCERRKAARTREEREKVGLWEPERMANGETLPQVMARSRTRHPQARVKMGRAAEAQGADPLRSVPFWPRRTLCPPNWWRYSTRGRPPPRRGSVWPDGITRSWHSATRSSTGCLRPSRITAGPS